MTDEKKAKKLNYLMNKISLVLKDATLQQGFEIICKRIVELEKENSELRGRITDLCKPPLYDGYSLQKEVAELKAQIERMKNCENCRYNCKENGEEYCYSPNGVCKRYSSTFDKDNWECAE